MDYANERAWLLAMDGAEPEPELDETKTPDFDGGVREPALPEADPFQAHNATVLQFLEETRGGW
jgi:hypothetical protein